MRLNGLPQVFSWSEEDLGLQRAWAIAMAHYLQEEMKEAGGQQGAASPNNLKLPGTVGRNSEPVFPRAQVTCSQPRTQGHDNSR